MTVGERIVMVAGRCLVTQVEYGTGQMVKCDVGVAKWGLAGAGMDLYR